VSSKENLLRSCSSTRSLQEGLRSTLMSSCSLRDDDDDTGTEFVVPLPLALLTPDWLFFTYCSADLQFSINPLYTVPIHTRATLLVNLSYFKFNRNLLEFFKSNALRGTPCLTYPLGMGLPLSFRLFIPCRRHERPKQIKPESITTFSKCK